MTEPLRQRIQVFNPNEEFTVIHRRLPHWSQMGTIVFITWRTWDSIPQSVLNNWLAERDEWLRSHGIDPGAADWPAKLRSVDATAVEEFQLRLSDRWNDHLDECHGECILRRREHSQVVAESLLHFDGERYDLTDFVVMPNHVHLLVAFANDESLLEQCESWKHFTATKINRALGRKGRFWQQDGFDHLVRSADQFEHYRRYVADNPRRARLQDGEFVHWSKPV